VSFWYGEVLKMQAEGGPAWDEYQRLVAAADQAMHGSPAHEELGRFMKAWEQNPQAVTKALMGDASKTRVAQLAAAAAPEE
jgi:hypothetical protein